MAFFRHNLNYWFINLGLHIISWDVLYWGKVTCKLRSPGVLMWLIGVKNVNLPKNQTVDNQLFNKITKKQKSC